MRSTNARPPSLRPLTPAAPRRARLGVAGAALLGAFLLVAGFLHTTARVDSAAKTAAPSASTAHATAPSPRSASDAPRNFADAFNAAARSPADTSRLAALTRAWALGDPASAADAVLARPALDHAALLTEIFASDALDPATARALAERLAADSPGLARACGYGLVHGLNRRGEFTAAAAFATEAPAALRRDFVIAAFFDWSRREPEDALLAAARVADPAARDHALQSSLSGWARLHPASLADAALAFPAGIERDAALTKALRAWMIADAEAAGDWLLAHGEVSPIAEKLLRED